MPSLDVACGLPTLRRGPSKVKRALEHRSYRKNEQEQWYTIGNMTHDTWQRRGQDIHVDIAGCAGRVRCLRGHSRHRACAALQGMEYSQHSWLAARLQFQAKGAFTACARTSPTGEMSKDSQCRCPSGRNSRHRRRSHLPSDTGSLTSPAAGTDEDMSAAYIQFASIFGSMHTCTLSRDQCFATHLFT